MPVSLDGCACRALIGIFEATQDSLKWIITTAIALNTENWARIYQMDKIRETNNCVDAKVVFTRREIVFDHASKSSKFVKKKTTLLSILF